MSQLVYTFCFNLIIFKIEKVNHISIKEFFHISLSIFLLTLKASMAIVLLLPVILFSYVRINLKFSNIEILRLLRFFY